MAITVNTPEELGKAIKDDAIEIILERDAEKQVVRIKAVGKVSWAIAFGAIVVAVILAIGTAGSGGTSAPVTIPGVIFSLGPASAILGTGTALAAVSIAVAAGGVGALTTLRKKYKLEDRSGKKVLVKKG